MIKHLDTQIEHDWIDVTITQRNREWNTWSYLNLKAPEILYRHETTLFIKNMIWLILNTDSYKAIIFNKTLKVLFHVCYKVRLINLYY